MRRFIILILAAALFAAPARVQAAGIVSLLAGGQRPVSLTEIDVGIHGSLGISFHGDASTGCAARGLCAYSGVTVWRPRSPGGSNGYLEIAKFRAHHHVSYQVYLTLVNGPFAGSGVTTVVQRALPGGSIATCADTGSARYSQIEQPIRAGGIAISVLSASGSLLGTRCAGPSAADIAPLITAPAIPLAAFANGRRTVGLHATSDFAANGFAGSVQSTLVLRLGRPNTQRIPAFRPPPFRQIGIVSERLTLVSLRGELTATVAGVANADECAVLDSCGLQGTYTIAPHPGVADGFLRAIGPAKRPYRDFLAALGLSRAGNPSGLDVYGSVSWDDGGSMSAAASQSGTCQDSAPLGPGTIYLQPRRHGSMEFDYQPESGVGTRCPGPAFGILGQGLASATIQRGATSARRFSVTLHGAGAFSDDGYVGRFHGALVATFVRGPAQPAQFPF